MERRNRQKNPNVERRSHNRRFFDRGGKGDVSDIMKRRSRTITRDRKGGCMLVLNFFIIC